ncbi:hypothetical protein [Burkholderia glumae]|uniref:hypothetical protein n=1 Tax=Burkholderia glumae TaxID=337 RepID=UPI003B9B195D
MEQKKSFSSQIMDFVQQQEEFRENHNFTVMYQADTDNQIVEKIFQGDPAANDEVRRLAALMLAEGWVEGYAK